MTPMTTIRTKTHVHYCPKCFRLGRRAQWECKASGCAESERVMSCPDHQKIFVDNADE